MRTLDRDQYLNAISMLPVEELLCLRDRTAAKYPQLKELIDSTLEGRAQSNPQIACEHFAIATHIHAEV